MSLSRQAPVANGSADGDAAPEALARAEDLQRAGDLAGALRAYEAALAAAPGDPDVLAALAGLAETMRLPKVAAGFWAEVRHADSRRLQAIDGQARALRELGQFDAAIALLRAAIVDHPLEPRLWNSLGVALTQNSQADLALTFLNEAVRLDGGFAAALYNRGSARFDLGDLEAAAADFELARRRTRKPSEAAMIDFAAATLALARGDLAAGWAAYESRLSPRLAGAPAFDTRVRRWRPGEPLGGRHLLAVGEQGLGDEVMFANTAPDLLAALGDGGRLSLAVEPRLVGLFARSFPQARVCAHETDRGGRRPRRRVPDLGGRSIDLWTPLGSPPCRFRRDLADFPQGTGYLRPDPARVARWRAWLGDGAPAVGISWRSGQMLGDRRRHYPPAELWDPLLAQPGVRFVNLQYGDCGEELAAFRARGGPEIAAPPGLDLRDDIEGLAALCVALDLAVCVANATGMLAGACGANVALISGPAAWSRLGTDRFPWYPQAHALTAPAFGDWGPAMARAATLVAALAAKVPTPAGPR